MCGLTGRAALGALPLTVLLVGCTQIGEEGREASTGASHQPAGRTATASMPSQSSIPEGGCGSDFCTGAEPPRHSTASPTPREPLPTCRQIRQRLKVTYRVISEPSSSGRAIWVRMTVQNRTSHDIGGFTGGILKVSEAKPGTPSVINWGGSSADDFRAVGQRTMRKDIFEYLGRKLQVPEDATVTAVRNISTYGALEWRDCSFGATILAPPGLVTGHLSGRWHVGAR